jgi:pimeloyl-ACP methyl ester carboxylesterase
VQQQPQRHLTKGRTVSIHREEIHCGLTVQGRELHIAATLSWRGNLARRTVQVLVPGFTYDRSYWDFPHRPNEHSYVRAAVDAGYATLALDRLGTGASSHPRARVLSLDTHVTALDAVVAALRAGALGDTAACQIITVGHSLGSAVVAAHAVSAAGGRAAARPDAVILTGFSHLVLPGTALFFAAAWWPAPRRGAKGRLPHGYRTTIPGMRRVLFYAPGPVCRDVVAVDERLKSTTAHFREVSGRAFTDVFRTRAVRLPVLVITGARDSVACGLPVWMRAERHFFAPSADVTLFSVRGAGHCLNTSPSGGQTFGRILDWCDSRIGTDR